MAKAAVWGGCTGGLGEGCWSDGGRLEAGHGEGRRVLGVLGPCQCLAPTGHKVRPAAWAFTTHVPRRW